MPRADDDAGAPPPTTAKKKPLAPLFLPKKRPAPAPARPPLKAPRTAVAWPIQSQRTVVLRFSMVRDANGRVRATLERGDKRAPSGGRRVFEAERTCKLALAHEGKAACDVRIHLTLDAAGADGAVWRDRRTYSGAKAAGGIGLLQSHLQKNIRRGNVDLAVRSAHELAGITFGPTDPTGLRTLVRRLPVIAVEDSAALPCVLPAVWYMLAMSPTEKSPLSYKATASDVLVICACVAQLAAHGRRDRHPAPRKGRNELPTNSVNLALLIRAAYGGMGGDVAMLKTRAHATAPSDDSNSPWLAPIAAPPALRPGDWLLEGVDFHQKGGEIIGRMRAKEISLQSVSDEDLKRWMWATRSAVNRRDGLREPSSAPNWADAGTRAADAAARDMIAGAWRG